MLLLAEGTAHFLEHMVFMGSEKYPNENAYDSFVSSNGGYCNAFTEGEYTVYQFEVQPEAMDGALDLFANCFKCPLLAPDAMDREVKAIENEFNLALTEDESRWAQLLSDRCAAGHPYHAFSWGNRASLVDVPKAHGLDIAEVLRTFHATYYYPANMKCVIVAPMELSALRALAAASFDPWPQSHQQSQPFYINPEQIYQPPLPAAALGRLSRIAALQKGHRLLLTFQLPPLLADYQTKTSSYLAHLLGHEGPGSLMSYLQRHSLASSLTAGVSDGNTDSSSLCALFSITVQLTKKGFVNWALVVEHIFSFLAMLSRLGPQDWVYEELAAMARLSFAFSDEEDAADLAERLAVEMLPLLARRREDVLRAGYAYDKWCPEAVRATAALLVPRAATIDLLSSHYARGLHDEGEDGEDSEDDEDDSEDDDSEEGSEAEDMEDDDDEEDVLADPALLLPASLPYNALLDGIEPQAGVEPYFSVHYWTLPIPEEMYSLWEQRAAVGCADFAMPPANPYIPQALGMLGDDEQAAKRHCSKGIDMTPVLHRSGEHCLFHTLDTRSERPKTAWFFHIASEAFFDTPAHAALLDLIVLMARDAQAEMLYMASLADLEAEVNSNSAALLVKVAGFSDKAPLLLQAVLRPLLTVALFDDADRLQRCVDQLKERYSNDLLTASRSASRALSAVLVRCHQPAGDKLAALVDIDCRKVKDFLRSALSSARMDALVQGNASHEEAVRVFDEMLALLPSTAQGIDKDMIVHLERRVLVVQSPPLGLSERNEAVQMSFLCGAYTHTLAAQWYLIEMLLTEPFFDDLRTKQQLGYEVRCSVDEAYGQLCLDLKVVSSTHPLLHILQQMLAFAATAHERILALPSDQLTAKVLPALLQTRTAPDLSLRDAADRAWSRVTDRSFVFDRRDHQVIALTETKCSEQSVLAALVEHALRQSPRVILALSTLNDVDKKQLTKALKATFPSCKVDMPSSLAVARKAFHTVKSQQQQKPQQATGKGAKKGKR